MRWLQTLLLTAGAVLLGMWLQTELEARAYQRDAALHLAASTAKNHAATAANGHRTSRELVGRLRIPRLGISVMVGEGTDERTLARAVGHVPGSAFPGEAGNIGLAGHRDTYFKKLARIRSGDHIRLTTADGDFEYRVFRTGVVSPHSTDVLRSAGEPLLTLVTCYPFHAIGPAPDRFVVQARAVSGEAALSKEASPRSRRS